MQMGQDGEHTAVVLRLGQQTELGEHGMHVGLDGFGVDEEPRRDGMVRSTLSHQSENLTFTPAQPLQRVVVPRPPEQALDHLRVQGGAAGGHAPDGLGNPATSPTRSLSR